MNSRTKCRRYRKRSTNSKKKQGELTKKINERSGGKDEFFQKKNEIRAELDAHSATINALMGQKDEIQKDKTNKQMESREMKNKLEKMKSTFGEYDTEEKIDKRIDEIEFHLQTATLPLREEKKFLSEIAELKRNRPKVAQVSGIEVSIKTQQDGLPIKEKMDKIFTELNKARELKKKAQEKLSELQEGRKEQLGDMPQFVKEREEVGAQIVEKIKERNQIRDDFRTKEREYNDFLYKQRQEKKERQWKEQQEREAAMAMERKQRMADKLDDQPYVAEITLVEQTILFCKGLIPSKDKEQKSEEKKTVFDNPDNTEVLVKKEDRDEFYFEPTKKKGKSKQKTGKSDAGGNKPIKHNAETFRLFDQLKLDAPITTDEIPGILEKLEEKLQMYKDKVKEWEEQREEKKRMILEGTYDPTQEENKEGEKEEDKEEEKERRKRRTIKKRRRRRQERRREEEGEAKKEEEKDEK